MSSQHAKRPLQYRKFARNGMVPDATFQNQLAEATNAAVRWRQREVFRYSTPLASIPAASDSPVVRWQGAWHSSPYCHRVKIRATIASGGATTADSGVLISIGDGSTTIGSTTIHVGGLPGQSGAGITNPSLEIGEYAATINIPLANRDDDLFLSVTDVVRARVHSLSISEDCSATAMLKTNNAQGTPILDKDREDVADRLRELWLHAASPPFHWTVDLQASPVVNSTTTSTNIIDGSTTVSAATVGPTLDLRNRSTVRRAATGVPCKLWVYASQTVSNGTVSMLDSSLTTVASVSITGAAGWYSSAAFDMPATVAKYDFLCTAGAAGTLSVHAVSLLQYEA